MAKNPLKRVLAGCLRYSGLAGGWGWDISFCFENTPGGLAAGRSGKQVFRLRSEATSERSVFCEWPRTNSELGKKSPVVIPLPHKKIQPFLMRRGGAFRPSLRDTERKGVIY
jgi:hypothetical protein